MVNLVGEARSVLLVVIEKDNFERMQKADPVTLESLREGGMLPPPMFPLNMSMLVAYEEDREKLYALAKAANDSDKGVKAFMEYLERGRTFIAGVDGVENFRRP
jgi:hypothetical protein